MSLHNCDMPTDDMNTLAEVIGQMASLKEVL